MDKGFRDRSARSANEACTNHNWPPRFGDTCRGQALRVFLRQVEQGLILLDAPLVRYVPGFRMADPRYTAITVRMLLNHSSGLAGTTFRNCMTTVPHPGYLDEVLATLAGQRLKAPPGYLSVYCNDGFTLLEALVRAVTGKPYAEVVQSAILDPLGMAHTAFTLAPFPPGSCARFYGSGNGQQQKFIGSLAAAGLYSTATDLATFARLFLNSGTVNSTRVLSSASVGQMAADQTLGSFNPVPSGATAFGLGWDSVAEPGLQAVGVAAWAKSGESIHYGAQLVVAPLAGLAVVALASNDAGYDPSTIAQRVILRALAESGRIASFPAPLVALAAPAVVPPARFLASISGDYAQPGLLFSLLAETDGSLSVGLSSDGQFLPGPTGLRYRSDGWFTSDLSPLRSQTVVERGGRQYLSMRARAGAGHYLIE